MDYRELAAAFFKDLHSLKKARPQKHISESLRGETFALQYIAFHDGPVLPGEISGEMGISSARIAAALNSLEKKGLVTRRIDPDDRRRILVELTELGKEQARKHTEEILDNITQMFSVLSEKDAREYVRITAILAKNMKGCGK
jgi:DNA-binding MarR family transcriptional regulator